MKKNPTIVLKIQKICVTNFSVRNTKKCVLNFSFKKF